MEAVLERKTNDAQLNTRIERSLKARGEAGLRAAGLSPSEAVRGLYEFAAEHEREPEKIRAVLHMDSEDEAERLRACRQRRQAFAQARRRTALLLHEAGLDGPCPGIDDLSFDELKALAYEHCAEAGE